MTQEPEGKMKLEEDRVTPPDILMGILGVERAPEAAAAMAQALSTADHATCEWYAASGPEVWTPVHVYAHMTGTTDSAKLASVASAACRHTTDAIAIDVDGIPCTMAVPGPAAGWADHWDDPVLPPDQDPDLLCMAVDWTISLLVSNARIVTPDDDDALATMRQVAVRAIDAESLGEDASFDDLCQAAAVSLLRHSGTRLPNHDRERIHALQRQVSEDSGIDDIASAWSAHGLVHRRLHADMDRRYVDPAAVMAFAQVLMSIDMPASKEAAADPAARSAFALHAVHDSIRTMLMHDIYEFGEAHLYSQTLGGRTTGQLARLVREEDASIMPLLDALTLRAFARRIMQTLGTTPFISDLPYLIAKTRSIVLVELDRTEAHAPMADGLAEWMIGLAVATILDSQEDETPHDPVWRTISRDLADDDGARSNPDALSAEHMDVIRGGRTVTRGRVVLTGLLIHCVDPNQDQETAECVSSIVPQAGPVVPGDVHLSRIARIPKLSRSLREAMEMAEELRDACGVHAAHLVGTIDGRALLIDSHDGDHDTVAGVGDAPTSWN
jgi:hypothetical protein